jgi:cellulose synthase/poly-beta-1,6-N-acetylglucosamine synthase-like glycosyltransferase
MRTAPQHTLGWPFARTGHAEPRAPLRLLSIRVLVALNLALGAWYLFWRALYSLNWSFWVVAVALIVAEAYSYADAWLFGLTMWRLRHRSPLPEPPADLTVDVFITCYNEPVQLVRETVQAAQRVRYPHQTFLLDDGDSADMLAMALEEGARYIARPPESRRFPRHAKAGNLNHALMQTHGDFVLVLDADQIPFLSILDQTLGYFVADPRIAFVQTPQWFYNVPADDPLGCQAPLFYGPIQQGKDGWNAAFFCGSNAVLRREALMQLGIRDYVRELTRRVRTALSSADRLLDRARRQLDNDPDALRAASALMELREAVREAQRQLNDGVPIQTVTWTVQKRARDVSRLLVAADLARIRAELSEVPGLEGDVDRGLDELLDDPQRLSTLVQHDASPLAAIGEVRGLLLAVDVDRGAEAQPVMPMSTISVTEDMATAMRLHSLGWRSVYHHEVLARGLAPQDLGSALQQRLRWAQGTLQVMLRENPLGVHGLSIGQRLMYVATMWSYVNGPFSLVFLVTPVLYLAFGILPVLAYSGEFFAHLLPYLVVNQVLFLVIGWGLPTWRGQQYSLALFPLWIRALQTTVANVWFGRSLGFVVTPKTKQHGGQAWRLIRWQLLTIAALVLSSIWAAGRVLLGFNDDWFPIAVNLVWVAYDVAMLSVLINAVRYTAEETDETDTVMAADVNGRLLAGGC